MEHICSHWFFHGPPTSFPTVLEDNLGDLCRRLQALYKVFFPEQFFAETEIYVYSKALIIIKNAMGDNRSLLYPHFAENKQLLNAARQQLESPTLQSFFASAECPEMQC